MVPGYGGADIRYDNRDDNLVSKDLVSVGRRSDLSQETPSDLTFTEGFVLSRLV